MCHKTFSQAINSLNGLRIHNQLYMLNERYRCQWVIAGLHHPDGLPYAKEQKNNGRSPGSDRPLAVTLLHQHF